MYASKSQSPMNAPNFSTILALDFGPLPASPSLDLLGRPRALTPPSLALFSKAEMQEAGVPPSAFTLSVLVKLANRSKRPEQGFELVEWLCAKYRIRMTVHVYNNLILAASTMGDLDKALFWRGFLQTLAGNVSISISLGGLAAQSPERGPLGRPRSKIGTQGSA